MKVVNLWKRVIKRNVRLMYNFFNQEKPNNNFKQDDRKSDD